jgi:TetR/AcrR family transcriptional regulator, regulator of autoinduction and epiphytic fitness
MTIVGRRERKLNQTRDMIAKAALALFDSRGYEQVTMEEIAEGADVAKGTLYNHFPSKDAVLAYSIRLQLASDLDQLEQRILSHPSFRARVTALLTVSAIWCENHRAYLPHYIRHVMQKISSSGELSPVQHDDLLAVYGALIQAAQSTGEIRSDFTADHLAAILHYHYFSCLLRWLENDRLNLRDELAAVVDLFISGAEGVASDDASRPPSRPQNKASGRKARA